MPIIRLAVIAGPDVGLDVAIDGDGAIGRSSDSSVKLSDVAVSRQQARLEVEGGAVAIVDTGGPNRSLVNGEPFVRARLHDGDRIEMGRTTLLVLPPEGGVLPAADAARTLRTVELADHTAFEPVLVALGDAWRGASAPTAIAQAACEAARTALAARRAVLVLHDASGRPQVVAAVPPAPAVVGVSDEDLASAGVLLERAGKTFAIAHLGAGARGAIVVEEPGGAARALERLTAIARLTGAQLDATAAGERSERARRTLVDRHAPRGLVGKSPALRKIAELVARVAPSASTVLVTGESGTGKERVAEAIHAASPRRGGPFVAINCAAIAESLVESELFGHERGAFTGASERRAGRFEQADGGTLFLDEVGELSPAVQARLLRVLETRRFERIGGARTVAVDVRIVAATHRDLEERVRSGAFREDLYYRLCVVRAHVPPLRDRPEDVVPLAEHFLASYGAAAGRPGLALSAAAKEALEAHWWPGNVRELRNAIERAVVMSDAAVIELEDLELLSRGPAPAKSGSIDDLERQAVIAALEASGGNKARAAQQLGIDRTTLYKKLRRYGLT